MLFGEQPFATRPFVTPNTSATIYSRALTAASNSTVKVGRTLGRKIVALGSETAKMARSLVRKMVASNSPEVATITKRAAMTRRATSTSTLKRVNRVNRIMAAANTPEAARLVRRVSKRVAGSSTSTVRMVRSSFRKLAVLTNAASAAMSMLRRVARLLPATSSGVARRRNGLLRIMSFVSTSQVRLRRYFPFHVSAAATIAAAITRNRFRVLFVQAAAGLSGIIRQRGAIISTASIIGVLTFRRTVALRRIAAGVGAARSLRSMLVRRAAVAGVAVARVSRQAAHILRAIANPATAALRRSVGKVLRAAGSGVAKVMRVLYRRVAATSTAAALRRYALARRQRATSAETAAMSRQRGRALRVVSAGIVKLVTNITQFIKASPGYLLKLAVRKRKIKLPK